MSTRTRGILLATVSAAAIAAGAVIVTHDSDETSNDAIVVRVDGLDKGTMDDRSLTVPREVVEQAAPRLEDNLKAAPPGTPSAQLESSQKAADRIAATQPPLPTAGAAAGFAGCRTSFVNNQSSRRGVRPQWQALHYTVSPNRPGWSDVDAIVALFNRSISQASSNFVIDGEGHCAYIVPIEAKAWTQAAANPFSVSYEIVATGHEGAYLPAAGLARLRSVTAQVAKRTGIPLRRGSSNGCAPGRSGLVQHKDFGICGGGHVDIAPFNADAVISQLVAGGRTVTHANRVTCGKINAWRKAGRRPGQWRTNTLVRIANLKKRGVVCTLKGARVA